MRELDEKSRTGLDWERLDMLFEQARVLDPDAQKEFLEKVIKQDPALGAELKEILSDKTNFHNFLKASPGEKLKAQWEISVGNQNTKPGVKKAEHPPKFKVVANAEKPSGFSFKPFQIDKYLLLERLGAGGMAEVYRAKLLGAGGFSKNIAIKRILPDFISDRGLRDMFEAEARLCSQLTHANVVQVFDFISQDQGCLIIMEYISGKNLRELSVRIKDIRGELPQDLSVFLISEICKGLHYAYTKKDPQGNPLHVIHRDVTPHNIMVGFDGAVKLLDFGIAKAKDSGLNKTATGMIKGKFAYMSPEQANAQELDHRTDIYCAGLVLYELLLGERALQGRTDVEILHAAQMGVHLDLEKLRGKIDSFLVQVLSRALAADLEVRYQTALEFSQDLQKYLNRHSPYFGQTHVAEMMEGLFHEEMAQEQQKVKEYDELVSHPSTNGFSGSHLNLETRTESVAASKTNVSRYLEKTQLPRNENHQGKNNSANTQMYAANPTTKRGSKSIQWDLIIGLGFLIGGIFVAVNNRQKINQVYRSFMDIIFSKGADSQLIPSTGTPNQTQIQIGEAYIKIKMHRDSQPGTLLLLWRDKQNSPEERILCKLGQLGTPCGPYRLSGAYPFSLKVVPGSVDLKISQLGCFGIYPGATFNKDSGECTISLSNGTTDLEVNLEKVR